MERTGPAPHGHDVYGLPRPQVRYDLELLESLNREYEAKRLLDQPRSHEPSSLAESARRRIRTVHERIDLGGMRLLEIGCGNGYETWLAATLLGADATGVDVVERAPWTQLRGDRVELRCVDITAERPFADGEFDRIMSFAAWEHMVHPYRALVETYRMLKPGGLAWIRANLHRGPQASHLYRHLYFPWPHLLFTDEVIEAFYRRQGKPPRGAAWVNRLTWMQYEEYMTRIGFQIEMLRFTVTPIDEEFFHRFGDILYRYPRWDLERDFFTVVLRKPGAGPPA